MPLIQLRDQHPGAELDHALAFADWLEGDTLASQVVTVPAGITLMTGAKAATISGNDVVFWLTGGVSGTTYAIEVEITTAGGRVLPVDCLIAIVDPSS